MKFSTAFTLALAPIVAMVAADDFKCDVKDLVVDASNVNAIQGTYRIQCNDIWGHLSYNLAILREDDNRHIGSPLPQEIPARNNAATNHYGAYLFPPGLIPSKRGYKVCLYHRNRNTTDGVAPDGRQCEDDD